MSAKNPAPGSQPERFAAYLNRLAQAAGHADRATPLQAYCTALCSFLESGRVWNPWRPASCNRLRLVSADAQQAPSRSELF